MSHDFAGPVAACKKHTISGAAIDALQSITLHRVIDNEKITLSAEDLWTHLNYQIIHLLDFIPVSNWGAQVSDPLFAVFIPLHDVLVRTKKLEAKIDFDLAGEGEPSNAGLPVTVGSVISNIVPSAIKKKISSKAIKKFSAKIGHSLDYQLNWA